jgi:hypothetical protein
MSEGAVVPPTALEYLQLFFPQYFDPDDPAYMDPVLVDAILDIAEDARPPCLSEKQQNLAQAYFAAYLIDVRQQTSSGQTAVTVAGPITSEREGDIAVTYADLSSSNQTNSRTQAPPATAWDQWNRMWIRCTRGTITTRFGDPCQQAQPSSTPTRGSTELSLTSRNLVRAL